MADSHDSSNSRPEHPGILQAFGVWLKIGLLSFGGPTGQIGLMHRELVERRRWISDERFLHALNYCMLLPGPEAQQLAIYIGWLMHRVWGGVLAGLLFVLPGAFLMGVISYVYVVFGQVPLVEAIFDGLKPAVIAIVAAAMLRIGSKVLTHPLMWALSLAAFCGIFFFNLPFPVIIIGAGFIGLGVHWAKPGLLGSASGHEAGAASADAGYAIGEAASERIGPASFGRFFRSALLWSFIWLAPLIACLSFLGRGHVLTELGLFFSKVALVTFGGAYAVLPYVAQQAVEQHGWLSAVEMMDGLGLAETTPGPLVLVLQFVGFLGGWIEAGSLAPLVMAIAAAALTSWMIFMPGCLFIFAGAPLAEGSRKHRGIASALTAITAAVVGVILNLTVWFGGQVIFPEMSTVDWFSLLLALTCFLLLQRYKWDVLWVIGLGAGVGVLFHFVVG
ncbi:MAG: chromate efflux transporter [Opitutales bacterium]|nr:chromate efflux transporter [Opitutales bacterium]